MNPIEQLAINFVLNIVQEVVKDPAKKALLQAQLIGVATDIATVYGYTMTPPAAGARK